ncbi:hypothetical protein WDW37_08775 [Bdellovibrionota bacterium FG-1]
MKLFLILGLALLMMSCGQVASVTPDPVTANFSSIYSHLFKTACIECHVPTGAATVAKGVQLDFTTQALAYATLTSGSVAAIDSVGKCPSVKLVVTGQVASSYLAGVLIQDYFKDNFAGVTGCTPYNVHLSDQNLTADEKTAIVSWIQNGAKDD